MITFFKRKTESDKLYDKYKSLLEEAHSLSTRNRRLSDGKFSEAEGVLRRIDELSELKK